MNSEFYQNCTIAALNGQLLSDQQCQDILHSKEIEVLPLLAAAYEVRKKFCGKEVSVHIINNAQNGYCPEDCHYCAQAKTSKADIEEYPLKPDAEILAEAKRAYESGAYRYCMVFAGRTPSTRRTEHLAKLIREIKAQYPINICVSAGLLDDEKAKILKDAGLDRLNHNLNTSERFYPEICTSHTFADRLSTLKSAQKAGIEICSGMIVGMGETIDDIIMVAKKLRELNSPSIPINFLVPIEGNLLNHPNLNPEFCLRILCLFRFLNPKAEIRIAAGREVHLRSMEVLALYAANSLFLDGYLNTKGNSRAKTLRMIKDAGFTIKSEINLDELLAQEEKTPDPLLAKENSAYLKTLKDLRPHLQPK